MVNSALAAKGRSILIRPRFNNWLYVVGSFSRAVVGQFAPSTGRKIGSVPLLCLKRRWTSSAEMPQDWSGWWQLKQLLPLVPILLKNGLLKSKLPVVLKVATAPAAFLEIRMLRFSAWSTEDIFKPARSSTAAAIPQPSFLDLIGLTPIRAWTCLCDVKQSFVETKDARSSRLGLGESLSGAASSHTQ